MRARWLRVCVSLFAGWMNDFAVIARRMGAGTMVLTRGMGGPGFVRSRYAFGLRRGSQLRSSAARGMGGGASTLKKRSICWLHLLTDRMPVSDAGGAGSSPAGAGAVCVGAPIVLQEQ